MDSIPSFVCPRFLGGMVIPLLLSLFCWSGVGVFYSTACAADQATFSWRANPQSDAVVGYRLYYGEASRFAGDGSEKQDFSYSSYIDFVNTQRCALTDSGPVCELYSNAEVVCEGLYGETPTCTLYKLDGLYYFTMTAYNDLAESDFTDELSERFAVQSVEEVTSLPLDSSGSATQSVEEIASSPLASSGSATQSVEEVASLPLASSSSATQSVEEVASLPLASNSSTTQSVEVVIPSPLDSSGITTLSVEIVISAPLQSNSSNTQGDEDLTDSSGGVNSSEDRVETESDATAEPSAQRDMLTEVMESNGVDENRPLPEIMANLQHIYLLLRR